MIKFIKTLAFANIFVWWTNAALCVFSKDEKQLYVSLLMGVIGIVATWFMLKLIKNQNEGR